VGFEVIMAVNVKISVCVDVMLCSLVDHTNVSGEPAASMFRVRVSQVWKKWCEYREREDWSLGPEGANANKENSVRNIGPLKGPFRMAAL
jgi:hypothetical protein